MTARVKRRISGKHGSAEKVKHGSAEKVKTLAQKAEPSTSFAARLPWFLEQCRAFQRLRKTWSAEKPCCLANGFTQPITPPSGDGRACYERLGEEQRELFKAYVERAEANGCIKPTGFNAHFLQLLHPELHTVLPKVSSGLPALRMSSRPRWRRGCCWVGSPATREKKAFQKSAQAPAAPSRRPAPPKPEPAGSAERRRSGFVGVSWHKNANCWDARWVEEGKDRHKPFYVHRYMQSMGLSQEKADARALRDAIAFRKRLFKGGGIQATGTVRKGGDRRALRAAEEEKPEAPKQKLKERGSGCKGIKWHGLYWRVDTRVGETRVQKNFRPERMTEESIEAARVTAVRHLEEERRQR